MKMITIETIINYYKSKKYQIILGDKRHWKTPILTPRAIQESDENHFTFISKKLTSEFSSLIESTKCRIILVEEELLKLTSIDLLNKQINFILSKAPKKDLLDFSKTFFPQNNIPIKTFIHPRAYVAPNVSIGHQTSIDACTIIESKVTIGDRCIIGSGTTIKSNTTIGNDVIIGSCNVIGGDGFGYIKNETNMYDYFPHYGGVIIKDHVHIGNNSCIDRGSLKDTIIREGVKIDNLVHIAHNVDIGQNSLIIACSMVAGSVTIGEDSWIAPSSTIRNGISIGDNVTVGLASTVTKSIESNQTVLGNPAIPKEDFLIVRKQQNEFLSKHKTQ